MRRYMEPIIIGGSASETYPYAVVCRCGQVLMEHKGIRFSDVAVLQPGITLRCPACGEATEWIR